MSSVPAYFDAFLEAIARGDLIDHVHLGYWDEPGAVGPRQARAGFAAAQERLSERLLDMLNLDGAERVLDVGCGFGGTLRAIRRRRPEAALYGVNLDPRQLAVGIGRDGSAGNAGWVAADACRLPFAAGAFDRVVCVEAAFHFASRRAFFEEAHRVLGGRGVLVMSDIVLSRPPLPPGTVAAYAERLEADFGPWPAKWASFDEIARDAGDAGFVLGVTDVTAETGPSYHTIAPDDHAEPSGAVVLRELHRRGCLRYLHLRLDKR